MIVITWTGLLRHRRNGMTGEEYATMRYRTGPVAGTMILAVLAALGIAGEITAGFRGQSVGSSIFGLVVIALFAGLAAGGLNALRGVRTGRRDDGTAVLRLPRLVPVHGSWWRTLAGPDIETVNLVYVGSRSRLYNVGVTLRDGSKLTCGAIAVERPRRAHLADTRAGRMVAQIRRDLGLDPG